MGEGGTSGCDPSITSDDPSLIHEHRWILTAKRRSKPPAGRRQPSVKDAGLGQEKSSRARTSQLCAVRVALADEVESRMPTDGVDDFLGCLDPQRRHDQQIRTLRHLLAETGFTVKPLPVRTCLLESTIVTVNAVGGAGVLSEAFAVASTSTTADSPESKQSSTARTATSTSETILNVAAPPLPISRLDTYVRDIQGGVPMSPTLGVLALLEAKPGKGEDLGKFLEAGATSPPPNRAP